MNVFDWFVCSLDFCIAMVFLDSEPFHRCVHPVWACHVLSFVFSARICRNVLVIAWMVLNTTSNFSMVA